MEFVALLVALAAAGFSMYRDRRSPLAWSLCLWAGIFLLYLLQPIRFEPLNWVTLIAISLGLIGLAAPSFLPHLKPHVARQGDRKLAFRRFLVVTIVIFALFVIGVIAFRAGVANAAGEAYEHLSLKEIRAAQNTVARGGGPVVLLAALGPVVSCLGVYGAYRFSRWWWLISVAAFGLVAQNPARINLLTLLVVTVVFWLYARQSLAKDDHPPGRKPFPIYVYVIMGVAVIAGLVYFTVVGASLSKNDTATEYSNWLPGWIAAPVLYFMGGIAAFSSATRMGVDPFQWGTTIFTPLKLVNAVFPDVHVPNTIAGAVHSPMWFNVYTGFGQMWFDFGYVGVFVLSAILGTLALYAHRRGEQGSMEWAWVAASSAALLFSLPQAFRLFNLDVLFQLALGAAAFYIIRWPGFRRRTPAKQPADAACADNENQR
ncbi:O-antigen polymerase [Leifsonia sp. PS1209]|uniref:O-antigen polymerase n=1 Tax=Leifsonia sp. PS1209 TaxID=2724914 RepID=UPI001442AB9A|nr:O-antigen polymerase [Leifsonia sp. PS1209]QIZ98427.1 oligosaccharide repeat unit polymerase [Leifsonia sp. PS1209]